MSYGKMDAAVGESCSNPGFKDRFTTPCCYADFTGKLSSCPECGAPITCTVEHQPLAVCTIGHDEDEE